MLAEALSAQPDLDVHLVLSEKVDDKFTKGSFQVHKVLPGYPHEAKGAARPFRQLVYYALQRRRMGTVLDELRPDIVHTQDFHWVTAPLEYRTMKRSGRRLCYTVHNVVMHTVPKRLKGLFLSRSRESYRLCDQLFVHADVLKAELEDFLKPHVPPIAVTPHGVLYQASGSDSHLTEARLQKKKLLFFGQARPNKGLDVLLDAIPFLGGYELTIAGERNGAAYWGSEIQPRISNLLAKNISISVEDRFVRDEDLPGLFQRHSCVALPYTRDFHSQSGILFLALGAGLPVVATDVGALGTTVRRMGIGEVVPPNDPESFARAVELVHHRPPEELDAKLLAAKEEWSWSRCAELTAEAYRKLRT